MLIALIVLSVALIVLASYLVYYKLQINDIRSQLSFIIKHDSFKFVQVQIRPKEIYSLVEQCNALLSKQRELNKQFIAKSEEVNGTIVSLSHDIRTPLTSLTGYLQLAQSTDDPVVKSRYCTLAQTRVDQIVTLVDELFFYTKLQNPEYIVEVDSVDMIDVLQKRLFYYIDDFSHRDSEPLLQIPDSPVYIVGNHHAIERVFSNIISNYFSHGKGSLSIHYEEKHDKSVIHFSNKLDVDHRLQPDKVFNRFYKEDPSRTVHSSGLGLSIVKSLMEKMNGSVEVSLEGAHFSISTTFDKVKKG